MNSFLTGTFDAVFGIVELGQRRWVLLLTLWVNLIGMERLTSVLEHDVLVVGRGVVEHAGAIDFEGRFVWSSACLLAHHIRAYFTPLSHNIRILPPQHRSHYIDSAFGSISPSYQCML